jgi:hypothetical protein
MEDQMKTKLFVTIFLLIGWYGFCGGGGEKGGGNDNENNNPVDPPEVIEVPDIRVPLTREIWERLGGSDYIKQYQLISFGRITLEREYTVLEDGREQGGRATFQDVYTRDVITIKDQTLGQVQEVENVPSGEIKLSVSFERLNANTLFFSSSARDTDGYFYLKYTTDKNLPQSGDKKGTLLYGGLSYTVIYGGEKKPYLLIKLSQNDIDRLNERTLEGRKVE